MRHYHIRISTCGEHTIFASKLISESYAEDLADMLNFDLYNQYIKAEVVACDGSKNGLCDVTDWVHPTLMRYVSEHLRDQYEKIWEERKYEN